MSAITIEEALKKYDRRLYSHKLRDETVTAFSNNLTMYITKVEQAVNEGQSEEHLKNITNDFLRGSFYHDDIYEINTEGRVDSSIKVNGEIRVLIEAKNPKNKTEMVSEEEVNVKAFHEIVFYYLKVTRDTSGEKIRRKPNVELRRCIIYDTKNGLLLMQMK